MATNDGKKKGLSKEYKGITKLNGGPGGWRCSCCNPYNCEPRKMKRKARRLVRRKMKQNTPTSEAEDFPTDEVEDFPEK